MKDRGDHVVSSSLSWGFAPRGEEPVEPLTGPQRLRSQVVCLRPGDPWEEAIHSSGSTGNWGPAGPPAGWKPGAPLEVAPCSGQ